MEEGGTGIEVRLTPEELALIRTALGYLQQTLSREEADELEQVQSLLERLERISQI